MWVSIVPYWCTWQCRLWGALEMIYHVHTRKKKLILGNVKQKTDARGHQVLHCLELCLCGEGWGYATRLACPACM